MAFKFALAAAFLLSATGIQAATLDAVSLLRQFNLITTGDVSVGSLHVHGRALIGGGISGNLAEVNHDNIDSIVASDFDELIVGNAGAGTNVRVLNNGTASYSGTPGYIDASVKTNPAAAPENYGQVMADFSAALGQMVPTSTADKTTLSNRISFNQAGSGIGVYSITTADLMNREIALALNGFTGLVINVIGSGSYDLLSNFIGDKSISQYVIWNFLGFDSIKLSRSVWGQVLADGSHVDLLADIEGSLYADTVFGQAQAHVQALGYTPPSPQVVTTPVPLPAGLPLLAAGLGMFGLLARRRGTSAASGGKA